MASTAAATKTVMDLKLETQECKRNGYILTGKFLGQGAYANVFLGHPTESRIRTNVKLRCAVRNGGKDLKVAIKIINIDSAPKVYITKFLPREIATMNKSYKHINVLYDMFATVKRVYLVLELASAGDLLSHINRCCARSSSQSVPEDSARKLFKGVASGLRFIHGRGIAHRDLKCENILLTKESEIKLCDFGFAIDVNDSVELLKTHCGSYAYASPEILRQQRYDGKMADLWSLGVVLFAMVNGGLPFKESDAKAVLEAMKKPVYFRTSLTSECKDLIRGLLRIKPQRRYTIDDVLNHSWITNLKTPECPLVVKVPRAADVGSENAHVQSHTNVSNHVMMSDPAAVSRYISNQMKKAKVERHSNHRSSRTYTVGKKAEQETKAKLRYVNSQAQSKTESKDEPNEEASAPKKSAMNRYFKATMENLKSQMTDSSPAHKMGLLVQKETGRKKHHHMDANVTDSMLNQPQGRSVKLQSIYDICRNDVTFNAKGNKREEAPTPVRTPHTREMASPNVVNIRIDQVVDLISSTGANECPNIKQKHAPATDSPIPKSPDTVSRKKAISKIDTGNKQRKESNQKKAWKKEKGTNQRTHSRKQECSQIAKVNIVHLNTSSVQLKRSNAYSQRKHAFTTNVKNTKVQDDTAITSQQPRKSTAWDTYQKSNVTNGKSTAGSGFSARAFTTPCKTRQTKPAVKYQETRSFKSKTPSTLSKENRRKSESNRLSSTNIRSKYSNGANYPGVVSTNHPPDVRPSKVGIQEGGELQSCQNSKDFTRSCGGTPTNMKRHDRPVENPADAWELSPKTTAGESMDVNQLLNYKVKQGCSVKATRNHGRHSHQAMHYAYLVSAEDRRPQTNFTQRWAECHKAVNDMSRVDYTGYLTSGNRILYRRARQPKQTMQTIQQLKKQARYAARSNRHFLPLPSCGIMDRNSPGRTKDALTIPSERLFNSKTVVLRLNKT